MANEYTIQVGQFVKCKDTYESAALQAEFQRNGIESEQICTPEGMIVKVTAIYGKNLHNCHQERGI